jgi:hypothetical protein
MTMTTTTTTAISGHATAPANGASAAPPGTSATHRVPPDGRLNPRGDVEARRFVEGFMREQIEQHAWLIDTQVVSLRTWWPYVNLCTAVAELAWPGDPRDATWLLAQVDADELFSASNPADQLAAFQAMKLDEEHVPILLECAVQLELGGARAPRAAQVPRPASAP